MQDGRQIQDGEKNSFQNDYGSTRSLSFNFKVNQT